MSYRLDPELARGLSIYGAETLSKCFNCGNCTATCEQSGRDVSLPRRFIRYMQLGMHDRMLEALEPWWCDYCGSCSDSCPRQAEPAALMMASRRWLSAKYDFTGLSKLLYRSTSWELLVLTVVALAVLAAFTLPAGFGFRLLAEHPEARQSVMLQYFAPAGIVHIGDLVFAAVMGFVLLSSAARMIYYTMRGSGAPPSAYLRQLWVPVWHGVSQIKWRRCNKMAKHWIRHLFLVTGYIIMFVLVVAYLPQFQVDSGGMRSWHWTSLLGYYATLVLLVVTGWILYDRVLRRDQIHKDSFFADWLFVSLLFLTAVTGITMHICRLLELPLATYVTYVVHLMVAVPIYLATFAKWAHLLHRPLASYLMAVKETARGELQVKLPEGCEVCTP